MNSYTQQYINPPAYRSRQDDDGPLLPVEVVTGEAPWAERAIGKGRMAADRLLGAVNPFHMQEGKITGLRAGRVGGAAAILSLLAAANELNDPTESAGRNLAQAAGVGVGGLGGSALGGAAAGFLGGGPIGALVGATLGGLLGTQAGRGLASAAADVVEGTPESRALKSMQDQARAATQLEAERMRVLMPIQDQAAQIALRNETARNRANAEIAGEQLLKQAIAQGLLAQQAGGAQQQLALTNAILGG